MIFIRKKILCIMLLTLSCFCFTSCESWNIIVQNNLGVTVQGIENYSSHTSSTSLTRYLLPSETFLEDYSYVVGDYGYLEYADPKWLLEGYETAIVSLQYDENNFQIAKDVCFSAMDFTDNAIPSVQGFEFLLSARLEDYPYQFIIVGFNEETKTLVFLGFSCSVIYKNRITSEIQDWESFLYKYYGTVFSPALE